MALEIGSFLTKAALTRATAGVEGARYIGARVTGISSLTVQGILVWLKDALDAKADKTEIAAKADRTELHAQAHALASTDHSDVDPNVAPANGNVLRYSTSNNKYAPHALTPENIGAYPQSSADFQTIANLPTNSYAASVLPKNLAPRLHYTMVATTSAGYPVTGLLVTFTYTQTKGYDDTVSNVGGYTKQILYAYNSSAIQTRSGVYSATGESWTAWRSY